jgi:uncharacterized protein with GYD domain
VGLPQHHRDARRDHDAKIATALNARGTLKTRTLTAIDIDEFIAGLGSGV